MDRKVLNSRITSGTLLVLLAGGSGSAVTNHFNQRPDVHTLVIANLEKRIEKIGTDVLDELKEMNNRLHKIDLRLNTIEVRAKK